MDASVIHTTYRELFGNDTALPALNSDFFDYQKSPDALTEAHEQRAAHPKSFDIIYGDTEVTAPKIAKIKQRPSHDLTTTAPIQIWEGTVSKVAEDGQMINAVLRDKSGGIEDHIIEISTEWVSDQDRDLVEEGAVFYLTLYKEKKHGSVKSSEELRFRRLPNWSKPELDKIRLEALNLFERFSKKNPFTQP